MSSSQTGMDQLHEQLSALADALEGFDDPAVDDHAGLQLMRSTLRERHDHVRDTIASAERSRLTLRLRGSPVADGTVPAPLLLDVLSALTASVSSLGSAIDAEHGADAALLHLDEVGGEEDITVVLRRPPGPPAAQRTDPDEEALVVDLAIERLCALLETEDAGADDRAEVLGPLVEALSGWAVEAVLEADLHTRPDRRVTVGAPELARLRAALSA